MIANAVSLEECAAYYDIPKLNLQKLKYADRVNGRNDRFEGDKVSLDYQNPLFHATSRAYYRALGVAGGNERELARVVAKKTGKNEWNIYMLFRNFKFKNQEFSKELITILEKYITENCLFANYILEK
ncbi:hypothetical protein CFT12S00416_05595 [Campylobacter fetus subsp. testudinum]|uniref:hypothetical protein n=1 Tax=Campylobacter fetus TaxID=196 RepID=UPI0008189B49|nr:hypothetical protein [Campylobacter fetus]OCR88898.1 hypothetical protein CFT12S00416_05595 [Campylobacter fetus subsp. testudinum]